MGAYPLWRLRIEVPAVSTREGTGSEVSAALEEALRATVPATALALEYVTGRRQGVDGVVHGALGLTRERIELSAWVERGESGFTLAIVDGRGTEHLLSSQALEDALRVLTTMIESGGIPGGYPYEVTE